MECLVLCNKGIEDIVSLDIKEMLGKGSKPGDGFVVFQVEKEEELCKIAYMSQSISGAFLIMDSFEFNSKQDIIQRAKKLKLKKWLDKDKSFKVDSLILGSEISQDEVKEEVGEVIIDGVIGYRQKVDLENPDLTLFVYINKNKAFLARDFAGKDLSKRNYRIFSNPRNIKSTIAYAMVRLSGCKEKDILIDPFCLSGSIAIEAALFCSKLAVRHFEKEEFLFNKFIGFDFESIDKKAVKDKGMIFALDGLFKNVDSSKKNAKIANMHKAITFSRLEIDWLDTKFDRESVDRIVTCLPNITKYSNRSDIIKIYNEFFHQAEFVLRKKGSVVVCTTNPDEIRKNSENSFKLEEQREVWQGKEKLVLMKFLRK